MCMMVQQVNFSSQKIIIREKGDATKHSYTNKAVAELEPLSSNFKITTDPTAAVTASTDDAAFPIKKLTGVRQQRLHEGGGTGATFRVTTDANGKIENVLIDATRLWLCSGR